MKKILLILILGVFIFAGCSSSATTEVESLSAPNGTGNGNHDLTSETNPIATITVKDYGTMTFELFPTAAPETVNNFIYLANSGYYDGLTCHRIVEDFMVQCGDPNGDGTGGPGYSIKGEFPNNGVNNTLTHEPGAMAMARSSDPDSAGSQFYMVTGEASFLDGDYAVFAYMLTGEEVLAELNTVPVTCMTRECSTPDPEVVIESVTVDTKGVEYPEPNKL